MLSITSALSAISLKFFHTALFSPDLSQGIRNSTNQTSLNAVFDDVSANSDLINTKDAAPSFLAALSFLRELTERVGLLD